jgi:hypothetical protein
MNPWLAVVCGVPVLLLLLLLLAALRVSGREEEEVARWIETMAAVGWMEWPAANGYYLQEDDDAD